MNRVRMAVVGVGHLGKEHARILAKLPEVELVGVVDLNFDLAKSVAHGVGATPYRDISGVLDQVDAASIVVPTTHHAAVARDFLRRGVSLLVEKPFTRTTAEADELLSLAQTHGALLQVGHIERFNPAFEEVQNRPFKPRYVRAQRTGPFTGRSTDIGVVLDLMIHDLDLTLALVGSPVAALSAWGMTVFGRHEDIASVHLQFKNGCAADIIASRAHAESCRSMQVWADEGTADLDFARRRVTLVQPTRAVQQVGLDPLKLDPASRLRIRDDLFLKYLEKHVIERPQQDQLTAELDHFVECVRTGSSPKVTGLDGREAVALGERIVDEIRRGRRDLAPTATPPLFPPTSRAAA